MKKAWVVSGTVDASFLGLTQKAAALIGAKGGSLTAVFIAPTLSEAQAGMLRAAGADAVVHLPADTEDLNAQGPVCRALTDLYAREGADVILFESSVFFSALAPAFACALRCGITADCTDLSWSEDGRLLQIRPAFGGRELAYNVNASGASIATVRKGVFLHRGDLSPVSAEILRLPLVVTEGQWTLLRRLGDEIKTAELCSASLVVSGGMGMQNRENFQKLFRLASLTGAAVGASRAAVAAGLVGYEHQVGQTGCSVRPELYLAFGISGAVQHLSGISGAKKIVAVNIDPDAPIHSYSDLSILADCGQVLDRLLVALEQAAPRDTPS